jgi:hypothetical protein
MFACISVVVVKGAYVRDCRGLGMCKVGTHTHTHTHTHTNTRYKNSKKFSLLVKVLELFLRLQSWNWHTNGSSDVVSPGDWLVSSVWFLLSTGLVAIGR